MSRHALPALVALPFTLTIEARGSRQAVGTGDSKPLSSTAVRQSRFATNEAIILSLTLAWQ